VITNTVVTESVVGHGAAPAAGLGNPAPAPAGVHELIRQRWSPRAFSSAPVPREVMALLFEAARWAPSSRNEQPWRFVVSSAAEDPEGHARIASTLAPLNASWAARAPVLALVAAKTAFSTAGAPNPTALYDAGQAVAQLVLEATALGLVVHQMGGFDRQRARTALGIPDGYEPVAALALGYPGDAAELAPELRARETAPRTRLPLRDLVFAGQWDRPLPPVPVSLQ